MHLGHQRAGGVHRAQAPAFGLVADRGRHAVRGEHHPGAVRHLAQLVHEDRPAGFQTGHHVRVVHDLLAHVDGRPMLLQDPLDDLDGPLHPGTERPRPGQQHLALTRGRGPAGQRGPGRAQRAEGGHPAAQRRRPEQRPARGVRDGPHDGHRPAPCRLDQLGRFHVHRDGAIRGQPVPLPRPEQMIDGDHPAGADPQPGPAQFARQQLRRRDRGDRLPVADLAGHHQVAGDQVISQPAAGARDGQRAERQRAQRGGPGRGPAWPVPGGHHRGGGAVQPAADRPGFQPQRRADQQAGLLHHRRPGPRAGLQRPGHD